MVGADPRLVRPEMRKVSAHKSEPNRSNYLKMRKKDQRDGGVVGRVLSFSLCAPDVFLTFCHLTGGFFHLFPPSQRFLLLQFKKLELLSFPTSLFLLSASVLGNLGNSGTLGHAAYDITS